LVQWPGRPDDGRVPQDTLGLIALLRWEHGRIFSNAESIGSESEESVNAFAISPPTNRALASVWLNITGGR
jgi:hypothetical protein